MAFTSRVTSATTSARIEARSTFGAADATSEGPVGIESVCCTSGPVGITSTAACVSFDIGDSPAVLAVMVTAVAASAPRVTNEHSRSVERFTIRTGP